MMNFDAKAHLPGLLDWMRQQMCACGGKTAVIGISGGKDSSVVAALSVAAYGREHVIGVLMPDDVQPDIDYSNGLVDFLQIPHYTFNIAGGTSGILNEMARLEIDASRQTRVNLPSRIRMATLYAIAQSVDGGIVINTSNLSEDWVGYCTIYGAQRGRVLAAGHVYDRRGHLRAGRRAGAPASVSSSKAALLRRPARPARRTKTTWASPIHAVNEYIRRGVVDPEIQKQIDAKHRVSRFIFETIPVYHNGLPIVIEDGTDFYK